MSRAWAARFLDALLLVRLSRPLLPRLTKSQGVRIGATRSWTASIPTRSGATGSGLWRSAASATYPFAKTMHKVPVRTGAIRSAARTSAAVDMSRAWAARFLDALLKEQKDTA